MTTQAFQRAQAREQKIWPAFIYSAAFNAAQKTERTLLYGLYSGAFLNMHNYLTDIEATSLENLLDDYNSKLAGLDIQGTLLLNSIAAKRYLAGIDALLNDQKLATRELKRQTEEAEWDARMAALETDRAALATLATKLSTAQKQTEAKITELQTRIAIEGMNLSLAEIEATEKEIQLAEMDLKVLRSAIEIAKIQMAVVQEGLELVEIELRKQRLKLDIADVQNRIARTTAMEAELDVAEARVSVSMTELEAMEAELAALEARGAIIDAEIARQATLQDHLADMGNLKQDMIALEMDNRVRRLENQEAKNELDNENRMALSELSLEHARTAQTIKEAETYDEWSVLFARLDAMKRIMEANIDAATTRQQTSIVTELTHAISTGSNG